MKNLQNLALGDFIDVARRRVWYWVIPFVLLSLGAFLYIWTMPSEYTSETTIRVAAGEVPEEFIGSVVSESVPERMELARQQIQGRAFLSEVAQEFNLDDISPRFRPMSANVFKLSYTSNDPVTAQAVTKRLAEQVMQLNANFRNRLGAVDQLLDEELRQAAAQLLEAEEAMREFSDRNFRGLPEQVDIDAIFAQLATLSSSRVSLEQTRTATLKRLDEQKLLQAASAPAPPAPIRSTPQPSTPTASPPPPPPPSPTEQALAQKRKELEGWELRYGRESKMPQLGRTRRQIEALEKQLLLEKQHIAEAAQSETAALAAPQENPVVSEVPALPGNIEQNPLLPVVVASTTTLETDLRRELQRLDAQIAAVQRNEQELAGRVGQYQRRLNLPPDVAQEMADLDRQLKAARDTHTLLFNRKLSSDLAGKVDNSNSHEAFVVIDAANLPQVPSGPQRQGLAIFALLGSLIAGVGLSLARELMDSTIRDEEEALTTLALPVLTSIPVIGSDRGFKWLRAASNDFRTKLSPALALEKNDGRRVVQKGKVAKFSLQDSDAKIQSVVWDAQTAPGEQYRLIRTTLALMQRQRENLKTVLMSSTIPNEGKTLSACCLASVLAQESGKRVLLVDADLRTASASRMLGLEVGTSKPGLSELLQGTAALEHCLMECEELNLFFLPSGHPTEHPTELLASPSLEKIMRNCQEIFDWIIIDSPPVLALADASLLQTVSDTTVLVVLAESTPVKLVQDSIRRIGPDRICGVLMNQVHRISSTSYYSDYYTANKD